MALFTNPFASTSGSLPASSQGSPVAAAMDSSRFPPFTTPSSLVSADSDAVRENNVDGIAAEAADVLPGVLDYDAVERIAAVSLTDSNRSPTEMRDPTGEQRPPVPSSTASGAPSPRKSPRRPLLSLGDIRPAMLTLSTIPLYVKSPDQIPPPVAFISLIDSDVPVPTDVATRRRSVDVGVLGLGYHRHGGGPAPSKRKRDAVGPDAGDKQIGVFGSGPKGGRDRLLGRHLASILAHSLALCADPMPLESFHSLPAIPGSASTSPATSRNASMTSVPSRNTSIVNSLDFDPSSPPPSFIPIPTRVSFPQLSETKRAKLIGSLQSWTFNAMSYSADDLLSCVGIIFESVRNMEGVDFDLDRLRSLLVSLRSAYHTRNGYHNFSHATDVTQALYTFLVRMGLAPPFYLLCEDDYDSNSGQGRRKWRRNRAVEEGGMGELLRPMDVFALMVAAIGHDVGHPGLSNAYMVNARTPVAQVYEDKSVLEYFHTVTLMHMLRRHGFEDLLGGGHLDQATPFRKVLEASILATDMSRHFGFVNEINEMGRRFGERRASGSGENLEADRLLLCSGLMKCADISNPTRPHRISRAWSTALLSEWAAQAAIEEEFNLPITVMCLDALDTKAQAKSQVGFIDLFARPLFDSMAGVVDEFADFAEKLRDGRKAWETISLQTDEAHQAYIAAEWTLSAPPTGRSGRTNTTAKSTLNLGNDLVTRSAPASTLVFQPISTAAPSGSLRTQPSNLPLSFNRPVSISSSSNSANESPLSATFPESAPSSFTTVSSAKHLSKGFTPSLDAFPLQSRIASDPRLMSTTNFLPISCGGTCQTYTAMCETCAKLPENRRGSLGRALAGAKAGEDENEEGVYVPFDFEHPEWPPFPFRPSRAS